MILCTDFFICNFNWNTNKSNSHNWLIFIIVNYCQLLVIIADYLWLFYYWWFLLMIILLLMVFIGDYFITDGFYWWLLVIILLLMVFIDDMFVKNFKKLTVVCINGGISELFLELAGKNLEN